MRMKVGLVAAAAVSVALVSAGPAGAAGANFKAFTLCNVEIVNPDDTVKDDQCFIGDPWGAAFVAKKKDAVEYTVCVKVLGQKGCFDQTTGDAGEPSYFKAYKKLPEATGEYKFKWKIEGKGVVKKRTVEILAEVEEPPAMTPG